MVACSNQAPTTLPTYDTGIDSESWAKIPAGEFAFGEHDEKVTIDYAYAIMVTDVTNAQFARYLNQAVAKGKIKIANDRVVGFYSGDKFTGKRHEKKIDAGDYVQMPIGDKNSRLVFDGKIFGVAPGYENHPVVAVTWFGAKAYCDYFGWSLPTEQEWEKAARSQDARAYPWGNNIALNVANFYNSRDPFEQGLGANGNTTPVGFYNGKTYGDYKTIDAKSPYGAYDMAGNVWQWTANIYEGMHYRIMRGGSKGDYDFNLRVWSRNSAEPDFYGPSVGFRCVRK
ncbi:MAG: formylglycine-generating enzyme family protein [Chloroflexi bacterium]|nr:formylglycine-generating enzyme family protein [Chloroflexota bacterium]